MALDLQLDAVSYTLAALLVALIVIPIVTSKDPDIHPYALLRQSDIAPFVPPSSGAYLEDWLTPRSSP